MAEFIGNGEALHLPPTTRMILNQRSRTYAEDDSFFLKIAPNENRVAILNNYEAFKWARGFDNEVHQNILNSKVLSTIHKRLVQKITTNVGIEGESDEMILELKRRTKNLDKSIIQQFDYTLGRGEACYTIEKIEAEGLETKAYVNVYPLERYRVQKDAYDEIIDIILHKVLINGKEQVGSWKKYILAEHRYKARDGKFYKEHIVTMYSSKNSYFTEIKETKWEEDELPNDIADQLGDIVLNKSVEIPTIGCYIVKNTLVNELCPNSDVGESQYIDCIDDAIAVDTSMTYREIDKNIGRARVLVPSLKVGMPEAISVSNNRAGRVEYSKQRTSVLDATFMQSYDAISTEGMKSPVQAVQFELRTEQWILDNKDYITKMCNKCGLSVFDFDPTMLGGTRTATEVDELGDITDQTVKAKRGLVESIINQMLKDIAELLGLEVHPFVKWDKSTTKNVSANVDLVIRKLQSGLISKKTALKDLNPNWNEEEIEAELRRIDSDTDSGDVDKEFIEI